ncbi:hypothetical protein M0R45_009277 [Rubus argutus]|uniref:Uncharacterized protein n=1 Tax=Rubus argutus TaxID=59490 RepID=A0AAW1Y5K3_RUBAR
MRARERRRTAWLVSDAGVLVGAGTGTWWRADWVAALGSTGSTTAFKGRAEWVEHGFDGNGLGFCNAGIDGDLKTHGVGRTDRRHGLINKLLWARAVCDVIIVAGLWRSTPALQIWAAAQARAFLLFFSSYFVSSRALFISCVFFSCF